MDKTIGEEAGFLMAWVEDFRSSFFNMLIGSWTYEPILSQLLPSTTRQAGY